MKVDHIEQVDELTVESKQVVLGNQYTVILHNDDYTSMDFVVQTLMKFFSHDFEQALTLMWQIHVEGSAICGIYRLEIAETKVLQVMDWAKQHEYPLRCSYRKLD